jgi:putative membrane protein
MREYLMNALKGMAMGMAEVVPGVSGGTIAFITGIYERLINVIKAIGPELFTALKKDGIKGGWRALDGNFLASLIAGMVIGIGVGVFLITYLLETFPLLVWSYFFGLILVSAWFVGKQIGVLNGRVILSMTVGSAVAYLITVAVPGVGNPALWFVFVSGAIAVSALLLPGISGSFILLLMGMYTYIIPTLKEALKTFELDKLLILTVFGLGMLVGMILFSRVISWTFKHYKDVTLAALTGFLIGSLNKIWPWQEVLITHQKESGDTVIVFSKSVLPQTFSGLANNFLYGNDPQILGCIVLMILGFLTVYLAETFSNKVSA